ncbi:hypothetical protein Pyn_20891 [Prunus yedoensis var. nudiflora]|uniref:Uncharacterized protein n=1 Tax=Prunus yedoensis var. nudiflora TaxID=2094558 RepID=A0A314YAE8_PRUYE|nr:hypothetical protein Pyn_20891 [Prunus yedoensis var. nudiflora]
MPLLTCGENPNFHCSAPVTWGQRLPNDNSSPKLEIRPVAPIVLIVRLSFKSSPKQLQQPVLEYTHPWRHS